MSSLAPKSLQVHLGYVLLSADFLFASVSNTPCVFFQSCLVGIVVPDPETMPEWAKKRGILGTYEDLCKNTVSGIWL